ncbi:hypothetical protein Tco_1084863 [Tanacetum coccineum]
MSLGIMLTGDMLPGKPLATSPKLTNTLNTVNDTFSGDMSPRKFMATSPPNVPEYLNPEKAQGHLYKDFGFLEGCVEDFLQLREHSVVKLTMKAVQKALSLAEAT